MTDNNGISHPLAQRIASLRLPGMHAAFLEQMARHDLGDMPFEERLGLLIDREIAERRSRALQRRLKKAQLRHSDACFEDINLSRPPVPCDCELCTDLKAFCRDPAACVAQFPLRKELRRHLHRHIDAYGLDMFHETERRGSPFTLVCTKNRASHQRRLDEYAEDVARMEALVRLAPDGAGDGDRTESLRRAVGGTK